MKMKLYYCPTCKFIYTERSGTGGKIFNMIVSNIPEGEKMKVEVKNCNNSLIATETRIGYRI